MNKLQDLVGQRAPEFYARVVDLLPAIHAISVTEYLPAPPVQARANLSDEERCLVEKAAQARGQARVSFLEVLLEMSAQVGHSVDGIIDAVSYHQSRPFKRRWLSRHDVAEGLLLDQCAVASPAKPLALLSKVKTDSGYVAHIPLLDFHVEKSRQSFRMVQAIARKLLDGTHAVLETARSYHVVGIGLVSDKQARRFLSQAMLFSPITDHAYIAHQLLEGESALRITGRGGVADAPIVVAVGGPEKSR